MGSKDGAVTGMVLAVTGAAYVSGRGLAPQGGGMVGLGEGDGGKEAWVLPEPRLNGSMPYMGNKMGR